MKAKIYQELLTSLQDNVGNVDFIFRFFASTILSVGLHLKIYSN